MDSGELQPGMIFGRDFRVVRALRAGGMGSVYVVDQLSTGKQRALKVMAPELATDPAIRDRFVFEARAASRIESDHVVEIVTAGIDDADAEFVVGVARKAAAGVRRHGFHAGQRIVVETDAGCAGSLGHV